MQNQELLQQLISQGIPKGTAERMIKALDEKPKKSSSAKRAFAIANSPKRKIKMDVEVTIVCDCCGNVKTINKTIEAYPDSPNTQKVACSICEKCPDYFRALTHEQLVSLALVRRHAAISNLYPRDSSQVKFAKKYTPEEIVVLDIKA